VNKLLLLGATLALPLLLTLGGGACEPPPSRSAVEAASASMAASSAAPLGTLEIDDVKVGDGAEAREGRAVSVHYVGKLKDGTVFDDSHPRKQPLTFIVGDKNIIAGWNKGILGMKKGGVRKLVVPPHLGYGESAQVKIPAGSTLYFELELVHVVE
jgi:FKBP-type peptidyl-prolyl cis-trans isomerase